MRREKVLKIDDPASRDNGRNYFLQEMPALKADKWANRALLALARSGVDVPEEILRGGMAGLAIIGLGKLVTLSHEEVQPLLDEMLGCAQFYAPDVGIKRPLIGEDIEEVQTLWKIRMEVMQLHVNFSLADLLQKFRNWMTSLQQSSAMPTSPTPSEPSLAAASPPSMN